MITFSAITRTYLSIVCILVGACSSSTKDDNSLALAKKQNDEEFDKREDENEADFIVDAIASNYAEVKLARLAKNRSSNPDVRELAATLETDHEKIITTLKGLANKKGISIPLEESSGAKDQIKKLSANADEKKFNRKWCDLLSDNHKKSIRKFENTWTKTDDLDLRNWINETLPHLKNHQQQLETCDENLHSTL